MSSEVLARHLRSLGLYNARLLSYDSVAFEMLVHALSTDQRSIYNAYAGAFATRTQCGLFRCA